MAAIEAGEAIVTGAVKIVPRPTTVTEFVEGQRVRLTWYQSTFPQTPPDEARMGIAFLDNMGAEIGAVTWAALIATTPSVWTKRTLDAFVPAGTEQLRLYMDFLRMHGPSSDGRIDAISCTVGGLPVTIVNAGAEAGSMAGWTGLYVPTGGAIGDATVSHSSDPAYEGDHFFDGAGNILNPDESGAYQDISPAAVTAGPLYLWGGYGPITVDGDTYLGLGDKAFAQQTAGAIGGIAQGYTLSLSGVEPAALPLLDPDEVKGASVTLYRAIFAADGKTLLDWHVFDRGRGDALTSDETIGGEAVINFAVESAARGLGRSGARMRSDSDQRTIDPSDGYFKNTAYAGEKMLYWGGKKPSRTSDSVSPPSNFGS